MPVALIDFMEKEADSNTSLSDYQVVKIFFGQMVGNTADQTALRWTAAPWLDDAAVVTDRT